MFFTLLWCPLTNIRGCPFTQPSLFTVVLAIAVGLPHPHMHRPLGLGTGAVIRWRLLIGYSCESRSRMFVHRGSYLSSSYSIVPLLLGLRVQCQSPHTEHS